MKEDFIKINDTIFKTNGEELDIYVNIYGDCEEAIPDIK